MASKPFNVGIVGYGLSAKVFHIPLILALPEDYKLYGIVQRSPKPDNDASKDHPGIHSWRSVDDMYKDPAVDVVIITSIPETHFAMCKDALQAGKHVVVEKPFVATAKEADTLIALQRQSGKLLTVYQNRRWDSDFLTLRHLMDRGTLGEIVEFETHFDRHRPEAPAESWKTVEAPAHGSIYELGTHLIDQVYHVFGLPKRVTGFVYQQRRGVAKNGPHDSHTVLMHYEGMIATVKAGVVSPEEEQLRFWVKGTEGSFKKFHLDVQEDHLKAGLRPDDKNFGVDPETHYGTLTTLQNPSSTPLRKTFPTVRAQTYVEYYRLFARALRDGEGGGNVVPVKAEEARDVLRIVEAALRSSGEGRSVDL